MLVLPQVLEEKRNGDAVAINVNLVEGSSGGG